MFNNKIELEVKKLYKLQELKKGLMQSMFVQNNIDCTKKHQKASKSIKKHKKAKKSKKKKNKAQKSSDIH